MNLPTIFKKCFFFSRHYSQIQKTFYLFGSLLRKLSISFRVSRRLFLSRAFLVLIQKCISSSIILHVLHNLSSVFCLFFFFFFFCFVFCLFVCFFFCFFFLFFFFVFCFSPNYLPRSILCLLSLILKEHMLSLTD